MYQSVMIPLITVGFLGIVNYLSQGVTVMVDNELKVRGHTFLHPPMDLTDVLYKSTGPINLIHLIRPIIITFALMGARFSRMQTPWLKCWDQ